MSLYREWHNSILHSRVLFFVHAVYELCAVQEHCFVKVRLCCVVLQSKIQCVCCKLLCKFFALEVDYYATACSNSIPLAQVVVHKVTRPSFPLGLEGVACETR